MAHELTNCDGAHRPVRIVYFGKLRDVLDDRIIELKKAAIAQLHNGYCRKCFRDRGPVINRVLVYWLLLFDVCKTIEMTINDCTVLDQHETAAYDAVLAQTFLIERLEH